MKTTLVSMSRHGRLVLSVLAAIALNVVATQRASAATVAADDASTYSSFPYSGPANNGTGFGAWTITGSDGGSHASIYLNTGSKAISTGTKSWGLWANTAHVIEAIRPFTGSLSVGQTFQIDLQFDGITTGVGHSAPPGNGNGRQAGFELRNGSTARFRFLFRGGQSHCEFSDNAGGTNSISTGGFPSGGFRVVFKLLSADTYEFAVLSGINGSVIYGSGTRTLMGTSGTGIDRVALYDNDNQTGGSGDCYFNSMKIGYDAPTISAQPSSTTTACVGTTTPAMTVTAASTDGSTLSYAWRKRGSGWGQTWTWTSSSTLGTVESDTDITSGLSWRLSTSGDVYRPLPATLVSNQTLSVDMDNGGVTSGNAVGISLRDSSANNVFEFYFKGGNANYFINDTRGADQNTGLPWTSGGVNLKFTLTSSTNYWLQITRLSDKATFNLTGSVIARRSIQRIRFFNFSGENAWFNSIVAAGADDNAANYDTTSWRAGNDKGQKPLTDGATGNGSSYSGSATSSFTITTAQTADSTNYDCAVMSGQGHTTISSASALTVNALPSATITKTSGTDCQSAQNTYSVPTASLYLWSLSDNTSGASISGSSTSSSVTVDNGGAGSYTINVAVTNASGCVSNSSMTITTVAAPSISTSPSSTNVCQGIAAVFSITGAGVSTYQWLVDKGSGFVEVNGGPGVDSGSDGTGGTTGTFTTVASTTGMSGYQYKCVVTGCGGAQDTSSAATLTVSATSVGGSIAADTNTVCTGTGTTLTLSGYTGNIQWQSRTGANAFANINGETSSTLNTGNLTTTTDFRAVVTSGVCSSGFSTTNTIAVSPASVGGTVTASASTICSGSSTTLTNTGFTGVNQWQSSTDGVNFAPIADATNATLSVSPTVNTYYYSVVTSGVCSSANSTTNLITVNTAASISVQPSATTNCSGTGAGFSVTAAGTSPNFAWRKRGAGWGTSGAWSFTAGGGGFFVGTSTNNGGGTGGIDTDGKAWGLYNSSGEANVVRNFTAMNVGDVFQVDMDNGGIDSGGPSVGFSLRNASGQNMMEFYFRGGQSFYEVNKSGGAVFTSLPWTNSGVRVTVTIASSTTFSLTAMRLSDSQTFGPYTGTFLNSGSISRFRAFNNKAGSGSGSDLFFNNIKVGPSTVNPLFDDNAAGYVTQGSDAGWLNSANNNNNGGNSPLANGGHITGATTSSLSISPATSSDAGSYDVVVYNSCGGQTATAAALTVNPLPTAFSVTGGGAYCSGGSGVAVGLSGSQTGVSYQLYRDNSGSPVTVGSPVAGTGSAISFGDQTEVDTYTVAATNDTTSCTANMTGSAAVTVNENPTAADNSYTRTSSMSLKIAKANLLANDSVGAGFYSASATTNSVTLTSDANYLYYPSNAANVSDRFTYTVTNASGCTASAYVYITIITDVFGTATGRVTTTTTNATAILSGIPGYSYSVQRATNVDFTLGISNFPSVTAPANGQVTNIDDFADLFGTPNFDVPEEAFYRLHYTP